MIDPKRSCSTCKYQNVRFNQPPCKVCMSKDKLVNWTEGSSQNVSSNRISKCQYYLDIARAVSARSTCLRRKYGCVIVKNDEIIATGYNGSPRGELNCCDTYQQCPRSNKAHNTGDYGDCSAVHAEQNAMISASRRDLVGADVYLNGCEFLGHGQTISMKECIPCPVCLRMLRNAGVRRITGPQGIIFSQE